MRIYKWELLKNEVAYVIGNLHNMSAPIFALLQSVEQQLTGQRIRNWRDNTKGMIEKAQVICDNWDIRQAGKLLELFPSIIAKEYRGRDFTCDMNKRGDWCLCFN